MRIDFNCSTISLSILSKAYKVSSISKLAMTYKTLKKQEKNIFNNDELKQTVRYLYIYGISEEFIALQLDLDVAVVKDILKELSLDDKLESIMSLNG